MFGFPGRLELSVTLDRGEGVGEVLVFARVGRNVVHHEGHFLSQVRAPPLLVERLSVWADRQRILSHVVRCQSSELHSGEKNEADGRLKQALGSDTSRRACRSA